MANLHGRLTSGSVFGDYRVESFIARGAMGVVYRATQLPLDRSVALKLVAPELAHDPAFRERFQREARLAASLDHPNVLPVYEAGEVGGQLFLAMRFVVGTDLASLIQREKALSPERAVAIITQVASGLDAAHSSGLVHRDVKPGNILIAQEYGEERAYLTDFGLTKRLATAAHLTRTGYMVGTLDYVAPEQIQGEAVNGRSDTYALACVLYHAVTGHIPFDRPGDVPKMRAHMSDPPPSASALAPGVTAALDAVIRQGMAKAPEERFASSGELARAANGALGGADDPRFARTEVDGMRIDPALAATAGPAQPTDGTPARPERRSVRPAAGRHLIPSGRRGSYAAAAALVILAGAVLAIVAGGGGGSTRAAAKPPPTATSLAQTSSPTITTSTTSESPAAALAAEYHARAARIVPRIRVVFARFPDARNFGEAKFSDRCLSVAAGLRAIADNLDLLSPPPSLLVVHEALVTRLREMEQAFRSLAADSDNRDFTGARRDLEKTRSALGKIDRGVQKVLG